MNNKINRLELENELNKQRKIEKINIMNEIIEYCEKTRDKIPGNGAPILRIRRLKQIDELLKNKYNFYI